MLFLLAAHASYDTDRAALERQRVALASLPREKARREARKLLTASLRDELFPAWFGTPWAFYGTSTTPGSGTIACGYFVSTLLEHAGLRVERRPLAQQASEYIVKTFADEGQIGRFRKGDRSAVTRWVAGQPDGIYAVGLDFHTGLLVKRGSEVEFCHSSFVTEVPAVQCNDPREDPGFVSNYHVVGPVFTDRVVDAWLDGTAIPTYRPR